MTLRGIVAINEQKPSTNVPYTSSVTTMSPGLVVATIWAMRALVAGASITDGGFEGLTTNSARTFGSASLSISESGNCHVGLPSSLCAFA